MARHIITMNTNPLTKTEFMNSTRRIYRRTCKAGSDGSGALLGRRSVRQAWPTLRVLLGTVWVLLAAGAASAVERYYSVPLVLSGADSVRQSFMRVINRSPQSGTVTVRAIDDEGQRKAPIELDLVAGTTRHFNSEDLESGNRAKGLSAGVGAGNGDWRLELVTDLDIEPLAYVRTSDGFVTSVHGTGARLRDGRYYLPFFNPGSNTRQVSSLRLVNASGEAVDVTVTGLDDRGRRPPSGDVRLTLPAGGSRTITSQELESGGAQHSGRFGDGTGKWRLFVSASRPISVMSLLASPTGNLADLSARGRADWLPLVLSASNPEREGFVRVINHSSQPGTVRIRAVDDAGRVRGPVTLSLDAGAATHFNSGDLERGNAAKGLSAGVGAGQGNWRLVLETDLNVEALAYVRTADGFVTSVHGLVEEAEDTWVVPFLNPASNFNQVSRLRLINRGSANASVSLSGLDDRGAGSDQVRLTLRAGESREVTTSELESGASGLSGRLGDGTGKWRLRVVADQPIHLMSLLESPTGNLTNLSVASGGAVGSTADGGGSDVVEDQLDDFDVTIPGSCAREVDVCVRDHQCEDGDEARVTVNGAVVFSGELFNAEHCVTVPVREGSNTIELYAINGTGFKGDYCSHIDANSGQIDVTGGNEQSQTWLHLGGAGSSAALNVTIGPDGPCRPERVVGDPGDGPSSGDGNDTRSGASALSIGLAADGDLDSPSDADYWRIEVPSRGRVVIESTGSTDTLGRLEDAAGARLAENDDGGAGTNFKIELDLNPGTYYVRISGVAGGTGPYALRVWHTPEGSSGVVRFQSFTFSDGINVRWGSGIADESLASAMDREGRVHIAWADAVAGEYDSSAKFTLRYCRFDGVNLGNCAELHPSVDKVYGIDMAVANNGTVHIAYAIRRTNATESYFKDGNRAIMYSQVSPLRTFTRQVSSNPTDPTQNHPDRSNAQFQSGSLEPSVQVEENGRRFAVYYESSLGFVVEAESEDGDHWEHRQLYKKSNYLGGGALYDLNLSGLEMPSLTSPVPSVATPLSPLPHIFGGRNLRHPEPTLPAYITGLIPAWAGERPDDKDGVDDLVYHVLENIESAEGIDGFNYWRSANSLQMYLAGGETQMSWLWTEGDSDTPYDERVGRVARYRIDGSGAYDLIDDIRLRRHPDIYVACDVEPSGHRFICIYSSGYYSSRQHWLVLDEDGDGTYEQREILKNFRFLPIREPTLSVRGSKIAFVARDDDSRGLKVVIGDLDGG